VRSVAVQRAILIGQLQARAAQLAGDRDVEVAVGAGAAATDRRRIVGKDRAGERHRLFAIDEVQAQARAHTERDRLGLACDVGPGRLSPASCSISQRARSNSARAAEPK